MTAPEKQPQFITKAQNSKIFACGRELGKDIDELRLIAKDISGVPSLSQLTKAQAFKLIDRLERRTTRKQAAGRKGKQNVTALITRKQRQYIWILAGKLGWDTERTAGFFQRQIGKHNPATSAEASKIITGLQKILTGGHGGDRYHENRN